CLGGAATAAKECLNVFVAELFAACRLGRRLLEVSCVQGLFEHRLKYRSLARNGAAAVEVFLEQYLHEPVNHHVARTSIESHKIFRIPACGDRREIGNAANILNDASFVSRTKDCI